MGHVTISHHRQTRVVAAAAAAGEIGADWRPCFIPLARRSDRTVVGESVTGKKTNIKIKSIAKRGV